MQHSHRKHNKGKVSYLESPERSKEFSPEQLFNLIPIKETDSVLDFGAGTGYFSIPAAKKVKGNVYALDIDAAMLEIINERAAQEQLTNIVPLLGSMESLTVPDDSIDLIIASLVLHEIQPLAPLLKQMKNVLKKDGYLVCLELEPKDHSEKAPRVTRAGMEKDMKAAGFQIAEVFSPSKSLYMLIGQKKN